MPAYVEEAQTQKILTAWFTVQRTWQMDQVWLRSDQHEFDSTRIVQTHTWNENNSVLSNPTWIFPWLYGLNMEQLEW